jgi:putative redox protein
MIRSTSTGLGLQAVFTNGREHGISDAPKDKGGQGEGFGPFDLLEASVSACMSITVRYYAWKHEIPLAVVTVQVVARRSEIGEIVFEYSVELDGPLTEDQRTRLRRAADACPVHQALLKPIEFRDVTGAPTH